MKSEVLAECSFTTQEPVWRRIDAWASAAGYRLTDWHMDRRVYANPIGCAAVGGCWTVSVDEVERNVHIAAAVRPMRFSRLRPLEAGGGDARADVDGAAPLARRDAARLKVRRRRPRSETSAVRSSAAVSVLSGVYLPRLAAPEGPVQASRESPRREWKSSRERV
jgi:hypothetical protein